MLDALNESENALLFEFLRGLAGKARMDFANGRKPNEYIERPVPIFADFGSKRLGWAKSTAKNKAAELIEGLWNAGHLEYLGNGKRIAKLKITNLPPQPVEEVAFVSQTPAPQVVQEIPETAAHEVSKPTTLQTPHEPPEADNYAIRKIREPRIGKKSRKALDLKEDKEFGEQNEARFYELMRRLADKLIKYPALIKEANVRRSMKRRGFRDRHGEDVAFFIETALGGKWKAIIDVKSRWGGKYGANQFNEYIKLYPEQRHADLKIAVAFGHKTPDREAVDYILNQLIRIGIFELKRIKPLIVKHFTKHPPNKI